MTSLQHQAVSRVIRLSCSACPPPSGRRSSVSGAARVAGARSTTPHRMKRREATCVAAEWKRKVSTAWTRERVVSGEGRGSTSSASCAPVCSAVQQQVQPAGIENALPPPAARTGDHDGRAHEAHGAVHHLHHRRALCHLQRQLHRLQQGGRCKDAGSQRCTDCHCNLSHAAASLLAAPASHAPATLQAGRRRCGWSGM